MNTIIQSIYATTYFSVRIVGSVLKAVIVYTIDAPTPNNVRILVLADVTLIMIMI
jgi:N-glycosylase/DNA lyase